MPLILAIEPDRRQAAHLTAVVRKRVRAELILVSTTQQALDAIGNRVPDLVLVPALLSPQDDAALATALRVIAAAANVQMLTIPVLAAPRPEKSGGVLSALRRGKKASAEPEGCDPNVFADQIASYLEHIVSERAELDADADADEPIVPAAAAVQAPAVAAAAPPEVPPPAPMTIEETPLVAAEPLYADTEPLPVGFTEREASPVLAYGEAETAPVAFAEPEAEPAVYAEPPRIEAIETTFAAPAEELMSAPPDESVSLALEEAVRGLFAESPAEPEEAFAAPVETIAEAAVSRHEPRPDFLVEQERAQDQEPELVAAAPELLTEAVVEAVPELSVPVAEKVVDLDSLAADELVAALQQIPLVAIAAVVPGDRKAPAVAAEQVREETPLAVEVKAPAAIAATPAPAPAPADAQPAAAKSEREWVALIESLRVDVERIRTKGGEKPAAPKPQPPARAAKAKKKPKPVQDEWGFFDPEQCGFAALLAKLEEVTEEEAPA